MNTTDKKNSNISNRDPKNQNQSTNDDKNTLMNEEMYDLDKMKQTDNSQKEIVNRGYTVRNGYDPNKPNPDKKQITNDEDDLDDLNDDFHTQNDLDDPELDMDGEDLNIVNDEFDNPTDTQDDDFYETDYLDDLDQDYKNESDKEKDKYIEDDIQ